MSKISQMNHTLTYKGAYRTYDVYRIQLLGFGKSSVINKCQSY